MLLGCDSRAAAAIARRTSADRVAGIARRAGPGERVVVDDYASVPSSLPLAGATIVNCVGIDRGSPAELERLNVTVPSVWAAAARDQGARRFVQLSSFSVYGGAGTIARDGACEPRSDYGRSKLAAENALASECGDLPLSILRVPILLAPAGTGGAPDKLAQLIALVKRLHVVPRPTRPVERSMISYDGLAAAVEQVIETRAPLACAADPEPFTYRLLTEMARRCGEPVVAVPLPPLATGLAKRITPALHERLFASSLLAAGDNLLAGRSDFLRLREVIASHFA